MSGRQTTEGGRQTGRMNMRRALIYDLNREREEDYQRAIVYHNRTSRRESSVRVPIEIHLPLENARYQSEAIPIPHLAIRSYPEARSSACEHTPAGDSGTRANDPATRKCGHGGKTVLWCSFPEALKVPELCVESGHQAVLLSLDATAFQKVFGRWISNSEPREVHIPLSAVLNLLFPGVHTNKPMSSCRKNSRSDKRRQIKTGARRGKDVGLTRDYSPDGRRALQFKAIENGVIHLTSQEQPCFAQGATQGDKIEGSGG